MSESVVYIIGTKIGAPVKIGTTVQLERRIDDIQLGSPERYVPLRTIPGGRGVEGWFHQRFAARRIHREWFEFDPDMLTVDPFAVNDPDAPKKLTLDPSTYVGLVILFLREKYLPIKGAATILAKDSGTSSRTTENWLAGTHAPNGEKLINLMAANPELHERINRLVAERRAARGEK